MCGHSVHEFIGFIEQLMEVTVILEIEKAVSERLYQSNLGSHVSWDGDVLQQIGTSHQAGLIKDQRYATVMV
jgi:hypothetical protein